MYINIDENGPVEAGQHRLIYKYYKHNVSTQHAL
jgi:hypothetical protein